MAAAAGLVADGASSLRALLDRVAVTWLAPLDWMAAAANADVFADIDTEQDLARVEPLAKGAG